VSDVVALETTLDRDVIITFFNIIFNAYRILVGKPEGRRPLGRPRRRWMDNIKMYLRDIGCDAMDWIAVAQDRY
jgi:hypothetical protein